MRAGQKQCKNFQWTSCVENKIVQFAHNHKTTLYRWQSRFSGSYSLTSSFWEQFHWLLHDFSTAAKMKTSSINHKKYPESNHILVIFWFSAIAIFLKLKSGAKAILTPCPNLGRCTQWEKNPCELFLKPHNLPSSCISLETLFTSSCDRPSVMTTKTFGMPLLMPASPVNKISRACLMALPATTTKKWHWL